MPRRTARTSCKDNLTPLAIDYHRNSICGVGFTVVIAHDSAEQRKMLIIRFSKQADKDAGGTLCAAFDLDLLAKDCIEFGVNSWCGDVYAAQVDPIIEQWEACGYKPFPLRKGEGG